MKTQGCFANGMKSTACTRRSCDVYHFCESSNNNFAVEFPTSRQEIDATIFRKWVRRGYFKKCFDTIGKLHVAFQKRPRPVKSRSVFEESLQHYELAGVRAVQLNCRHVLLSVWSDSVTFPVFKK